VTDHGPSAVTRHAVVSIVVGVEVRRGVLMYCCDPNGAENGRDYRSKNDEQRIVFLQRREAVRGHAYRHSILLGIFAIRPESISLDRNSFIRGFDE
jgi:hypothetical protein